MKKTQIDEFRTRHLKALEALNQLYETWIDINNPTALNYPPYLPSFEEFISDFAEIKIGTMQTEVSKKIKNVEDAVVFLIELHKNNEGFHPDDDAHDIVWSTVAPTIYEKDELNKRMDECRKFIDPCAVLVELDK